MIKSQEEALLVLRLCAQRVSKTLNLLTKAFKSQANFIQDPSKLKAALCTRRSGKSFGAALYLFKEALENSNVSCLYIALTRDSAKRIMWNDIVKTIDKQYNIGCKFNETLLTITLPNNSIIYLMGMDNNSSEMEKALGLCLKLIIIDEAASFRQDLNRLVYSILKPTTIDLQGTICMIGTPSNLLKGLFYDVTTGKEPGWAVHKWSAFDNPHIANNWDAEIKHLKLTHPNIEETPGYQQMYLGKWFIDTSKLVYKFNRDRNIYETLPQAKYYYVLGVDLGYNDASAFVVVAYSDYDPNLYVLHTFSKSGMTISEVAEYIKYLKKQYDIYKILIDNANKQAVEEMKQRYQLPLVAAEKQGKTDFIEIMNAEFINGKIKLHKDCMPLAEEYEQLIWDDRALLIGKREEHAACANHLADSCLYAWRYTYAYCARKEPIKISRDSNDWMKQYEQEQSDLLEQQSNYV